MPPCLPPNISITTQVFSLSDSPVYKPFPFSVSDGCGGNSSLISCSFKTNNTAINVTTNSLIFPPTSSLGIFNATVNCSQQNQLYSVLDFDYTIVFGKNLKYSPSPVLQVVRDCVSTPVGSDSFGITEDGGVTPGMISITPTNPSTDGDVLNLTFPNPQLGSNSFAYSDVIAGLAYIRPNLVSTVFSSRKAVFNVLIRDPSQNSLAVQTKFNVTWNYCPRLSSSNITITTPNITTPVVIMSSMVGLSEIHGLNVWEVPWSITSLSGGTLEYYCPDNSCDIQGKKWLPLQVPTTIKQSWIISNGLRWNPKIAAEGVNYVSTWQTQTSDSSDPLNLTINFVVNSTTSSTDVPLPYDSSDSCNLVTIKKSGVSLTESLTNAPFQSQSPIRPICITSPVTTTDIFINDFIISALQPTTLTVSSYVIIDPSVLPPGFTLLTFTGSSSTQGQLYQCLHLSSSPSIASNLISITLPQISIANNIGLQTTDTIVVLRYDPKTAQISPLKPISWSQDTSKPAALRLKVSVPDSGYYMFGIPTLGVILPVASNSWIDYSTSYGSMNTIVDSGNLQLTFTASASIRFAVMKPPQINWMPDGYNVIETFIFAGDYLSDNTISANAILTYKSSQQNVFWGLQQLCDRCPVGYNWTINPNSTLSKGGVFNGIEYPDSFFLKLNTTAVGTWAILEKKPYISASSLAMRLHPNMVVYTVLTMMSLF